MVKNIRQAKSLKRWLMVILAGTALLIFFTLVGLRFAIAQQATGVGIPSTLTLEPTPGLVVYGYVQRINGVGVGGVNIYRSFAGYPGVLVATTDASGYYQSDFMYIYGDEMVSVWADGGGLEYEPMQYFWRHYYGFEWHSCNFLAHLTWLIHIPFVTR
jgi:hypothetical protein